MSKYLKCEHITLKNGYPFCKLANYNCGKVRYCMSVSDYKHTDSYFKDGCKVKNEYNKNK